MRRETINKDNLKLYAEMIPAELGPLLFQKNTHAFGAIFAETPVGVAMWDDAENDSYGRLMSIYVAPEARRMGIGTYLLESVMKDMQDAGKEGISGKYSDAGDRALLTPFFTEFGIEIETLDVPVGRVTLLEAVKAIKNIPGAGKETGVSSADLSGREKNTAIKWIETLSGESAGQYMTGKPESFFVLDGEDVRSALLFRKEDEETLSLDYAISQDPKSLVGLLSLAVQHYALEYSKDTKIEMLLATHSGLGLYERLFGTTPLSTRVSEYRQNFQYL